MITYCSARASQPARYPDSGTDLDLVVLAAGLELRVERGQNWSAG